ncbi:hypothetical protein F5884DRAFT_781633 [Xylogone sp. PMI_703]|nr:hypothetical protein F5884DRAFT_781633 [Xylogone sp. PMI_703]
MTVISKIVVATTAVASLVTANSVTFVNQDSTPRKVVFTATAGGEAIPSLQVAGSGTAKQSFPDSWIGNWYTVSEGSQDTPGMLGEVAFNSWQGITFFDVSAIVNPNDHNGVKELYPKSSKTPMSGCQTFPCSNAYNLPDDLATLSTNERDLECLIGNLSGKNKRDGSSAKFSHDFVDGKVH